MTTKFLTILADPPWPQKMSGQYKSRHHRPRFLPYQTMDISAIAGISVREWAEVGCHLWLWTTNAFLRQGFEVMEAWGFKYLAPIHWIKPSGLGNYVIHRTQTILLGYRGRCIFDKLRYFPNLIHTGDPVRHSQKPDGVYELIEKVSHGPRLELFARKKRDGWVAWGNEVESEVDLLKAESVK